MTPAARCRLAIAMTALAGYAACGDEPADTIVTAGPPPVAYENEGRIDHTRPHVPNVTDGLDRTLATAPKASRSKPRPRPAQPARTPPPAGGDVRRVESTAYCLTGTMANGQRVYRGAVAMNGVPLGSVWQVDGGGTYTVADRIGHSSQFDIAMPGDCAGAIAYGRRVITVRRVR